MPYAKRTGKAPHTPKRNPIYYAKRLIGTIVRKSGGIVEFQQTRRQNQILHKRPAIAFDRGVLAAVEQAGATCVRIRISETRDEFTVNIAAIHQHGFHANWGHGDQIVLELKYWSRNSQPAQAEQLALGGATGTDTVSSAIQLTLFAEVR